MKNKFFLLSILFFVNSGLLNAQLKNDLEIAMQRKTDATINLLSLPPDYPAHYGAPSIPEITEILNRILTYLDTVTPIQVVNRETGKIISSTSIPDKNAILFPGDFRLLNYAWGVTYYGMLSVANVTSDLRFSKYSYDRFNFINEFVPYFNKFSETYPNAINPLAGVINPRVLDDAGAMCAAMIKATITGPNTELRPLIDNYVNFIYHKQFRLPDGTFARNRPFPNSVWADDLYMSVPALAQMGKLTGEQKYFDDAAMQIIQFAELLFNKNKGLYMHGWVQGMEQHPDYYWGRANGWAILALVELLDVLPHDHARRIELIGLLKAHVKGLAEYQSGSGLWHQLLDKNDSYIETSCSAMFVFGIAKAINEKWIDGSAYSSMLVQAWNALTTRINDVGQVTGTCVGSGLAFDPVYYYYRPVSEYAAHGYGPVLMAGSEMIRFVREAKLKPHGTILLYDNQ